MEDKLSKLAEHWRTLAVGAHTAGDEWAVRYLDEHFVLRENDDEQPEPEGDDEDYDDDGNLRAGCNHNATFECECGDEEEPE